MNFQTTSRTLSDFFRSHDLDVSLYDIHIVTHSPLALDQLRLALSSDFKYLFDEEFDKWPRNHFVGWFMAHGVRFRTGYVDRYDLPVHKIASVT